MKIRLIYCGKTKVSYLREGELEYLKRLKRFAKIEEVIIPEVKQQKGITNQQIKDWEAPLILNQLNSNDYNVMLDEKGKSYTSIQFSHWITDQEMNARNINFIVGGPYGFSQKIYEAVNEKISLSKMTFSHQMIRLFFVEQLYRAYSIKGGLPYHHE